MIKLPTKRTEIEKDLSKYTIFLYGREKIGKTTLAAQFPDALFLMFEPGAKSLEIFRIDINTWAEFLEAIKLHRKNGVRLNSINSTIMLIGEMPFIATHYQLLGNYYIDNVGIIPRWYKSHKIIKNLFDIFASSKTN